MTVAISSSRCTGKRNVDSAARLSALVDALNRIALQFDMPIIVSTHPRTRKRLDALNDVALDERVQWMKPFGFHDYNKLQMRAFCAISDSGTIAEESSMLGLLHPPSYQIERLREA